jgi:lipopolysaccharide transport system ATP-binding protein
MKSALHVDCLSKQYRLGSRPRGEYQTLRESLVATTTAPWRRLRRLVGSVPVNESAANGSTLWALRDVSFDVTPGEVVGVIGHNGAGKSTLLKILSRVTEPSSGRAVMRGRLGSLLEVGTGFHPELSGRENVFLSGIILGMSRRDIVKKFDEIVAFAEIEQFLDTPVKRYSSGMYVRLAFAVAAHLEPEILVVDEVLAVGDVAFQKKCLQRMQDAGREGRTILFVSHNLAALQLLCRRGIVLERGQLVADGPVAESTAYYLRRIEAAATTDLAQRTDRRGSGGVRLVKVEIASDAASDGQAVMGRPVRFVFHLDHVEPNVTCIFTVYDSSGCTLARFNSALGSLDDVCEPRAEPTIVCTLEEMLLAPGRYRIDVALRVGDEVQDRIEAAAFFDVVRGAVRGREPARGGGPWMVCLPHRWSNPTRS